MSISEGAATMAISYHEVERLQELYPDYQIELRKGRIIIMSPSDFLSGEIGMRFGTLLSNWVYSRSLGRVSDASAGFRLPNGDLLSPDVSFVSREQLKQSPRTFASVVPELIVEIKSSSDRVRELEEKIVLFLSQGVQVGILIDPDKRTVSIYRRGDLNEDAEDEVSISPKTVLGDSDTLIIPELFPGWEMPVVSLWPPLYE